MKLAGAHIKALAPACVAPGMAATNLNAAFQHYGITDLDEIRALLAQLAVESSQFNATLENMNYGAAGLLATWPKRFTSETAKAYERRPEAIANHVYANRMGNGPEASGDGWRHRGRGWMQATGKTRQEAILAKLGLPIDRPELLSEPRWAAFSACQFWVDEKCAALKNDTEALTLRINGGRNGLAERKAFRATANRVIV